MTRLLICALLLTGCAGNTNSTPKCDEFEQTADRLAIEFDVASTDVTARTRSARTLAQFRADIPIPVT